MEEYKETCKDGVNGFQKAVDSLIDKLMRDLEDQFKEDVKVRQSSESYVVQDIKLRKRESSHLTFFVISFLFGATVKQATQTHEISTKSPESPLLSTSGLSRIAHIRKKITDVHYRGLVLKRILSEIPVLVLTDSFLHRDKHFLLWFLKEELKRRSSFLAVIVKST